jgi:hypothetical protein
MITDEGDIDADNTEKSVLNTCHDAGPTKVVEPALHTQAAASMELVDRTSSATLPMGAVVANALIVKDSVTPGSAVPANEVGLVTGGGEVSTMHYKNDHIQDVALIEEPRDDSTISSSSQNVLIGENNNHRETHPATGIEVRSNPLLHIELD